MEETLRTLEERELELQQAIEFGQSLIQCKQELEDENDSLKQELTLLKQQFGDQYQLFQQVKNERNNLHFETETLKTQIEDLQEKLTQYQKSNTLLSKLKQELMDQNHSLVEKVDQLEESLHYYKEEYLKLKQASLTTITTTTTNNNNTLFTTTVVTEEAMEQQIKMRVQVIKLQMQRDLEEQNQFLCDKFETWKQTHLSHLQSKIQTVKLDFISLYKTLQSMNHLIQQSSSQIIDAVNNNDPEDVMTKYPMLYASIQSKIINSLGLETHYESFGEKSVKPSKRGNVQFKLSKMSDYKDCCLQISVMGLCIFDSVGKSLLYCYSLYKATWKVISKKLKNNVCDLEMILQSTPSTLLNIRIKDAKEAVEWQEFLHIVMTS